MTLKQLKEKVKVTYFGSCYYDYKVTITYRGKQYNCLSNNFAAWDTIHGNGNAIYYTTDKKAYQAFWNECKEHNHLK